MDISNNYIHTLIACNQIVKLNNIIENNKIENIYKKLFNILNARENKNNLLGQIWINHLQEQLNDFLNTIQECENFVNNYDNINKNSQINNKEISALYLLSIMKKKQLI